MPITVLPEKQLKEVKDGATVAQIGGLTSMSPGGVAAGGKIAAIANFGCQVEDIDLEAGATLDWEFHPTTIALGTSTLKYFKGAALMNPVIIIASFVFLFSLGFMIRMGFEMTWGQALGNVRTPGMLFIPFMFVLPGTSLVSARLALPPDFSDGFGVYGLFLMIGCLVSPLFVYFFVCRNLSLGATTVPDPRLNDYTNMSNTNLMEEPTVPVKQYTGAKRILYKIAFGERVWVSVGEDSYFVEQYGVVFESYKEGRTWWVIIEVSTIICVGLLSSWHPSSPQECNSRNGIFTALFGVFFLLLLFIRPYASMFDAVLMGAVAGLMFVAVLMMTIGIANEVPATSALYVMAGVLLLVTTILTFIKAAFDIVAYGTDIWVGRKSGAREMTRVHNEFETDIMLCEARPIDHDIAGSEAEAKPSSMLLPKQKDPIESSFRLSETPSSDAHDNLCEPLVSFSSSPQDFEAPETKPKRKTTNKLTYI